MGPFRFVAGGVGYKKPTIKIQLAMKKLNGKVKLASESEMINSSQRLSEDRL